MIWENGQNKDSAMNVIKGQSISPDGRKTLKRKRFVKRKHDIPVEKLAKEILSGSRIALARGITLIESISNQDQETGQQLLLRTSSHVGRSIRIGITGVPGAGKSTFIEKFGLMLTERGYKVAILAIDPSSTITGGSILGDKTRMDKLANDSKAFIRPSPTSGTLGGVHKKTRETMLLCEAAGYDVILIETVGVGQSETVVRNIVDIFVLLALTGAGDELQGMKKGIMELTDLIIVHKADGKNVRQANRTVRQYRQILHLLQPATPGWTSKVLPVSSLEQIGLEEVWETIQKFKKEMKKSKQWEGRRKKQTKDWFHSLIKDRLIDSFYAEAGKEDHVKLLEEQLLNDELTVTDAVEQLFK